MWIYNKYRAAAAFCFFFAAEKEVGLAAMSEKSSIR
jgi:hypothetical protein